MAAATTRTTQLQNGVKRTAAVANWPEALVVGKGDGRALRPAVRVDAAEVGGFDNHDHRSAMALCTADCCFWGKHVVHQCDNSSELFSSVFVFIF